MLIELGCERAAKKDIRKDMQLKLSKHRANLHHGDKKCKDHKMSFHFL